MTEGTSTDAPEVQAHRRGDDVEIELGPRADGDRSSPADLAEALARRIAEVAASPLADGARLHLAADHPADRLDPLPEAVADAAGFHQRRDLLQLRRPLPVPGDHPLRARRDDLPELTIRSFADGDTEAWIRVNNRAFADHADQGHETLDTLAQRMDEPWFDPAGFLVADDAGRPGELAGFCWTKVHAETDDDVELGEIYVIGIDPLHRGEGMGPILTLAGLDHLADIGIATSVLYVDAENEAAVRLYDRLGFTVHARRRVYTA